MVFWGWVQVKSPPQFAYAPSVTSTLYPCEKEVVSASASPSPASHDKEMLSHYKSAITIYDGRTVPVHWSASQLLQEHERRHSPYDADPFHNDSTQADNVSRGSGPFSGSYHLSSGSATYGLADADSAAVAAAAAAAAAHLYANNASSATPPSDYRPYSIEYEGSSVEHDNYTPMIANAISAGSSASSTSNNNNNNCNSSSSKSGRPPTFPKPTSAARLHGSFSSLASERKKQRNVTQV